eukprot:jgi/Botrbrau1/9210/Bobra.0028s0006.2
MFQLCTILDSLLTAGPLPEEVRWKSISLATGNGEPGQSITLSINERASLLRQRAASLAGDLLILFAGLKIVTRSRTLPALVWEFSVFLVLYGFLCTVMDVVSVPAITVGMRLAPHFSQPWLSASFTELWSKRWNLTAGTALRNLIFDPIMEGRLVHDPTRPRAPRSHFRYVLAISATFAFSGIMHETLFWYFRGYWPGLTGMWMIFFTAWGPFIVIEQLLLSALRKRGLAPPAWLSVPLTLLLGLTWSHLYFFPVMMKSGIYDDALHSLHTTLEAITGAIPTGHTEL